MRNWGRIFICFLIIGFPSLANTAPYAAVVMDAATGKILEGENADQSRFPASLTKKMTLYLIFEALESGRLKPTSTLYVSAHAASQPPSKLGLKKGERVAIETVIMALVTRSANDVAMVAAEALGTTQGGFSRMSNRKARELGMTKTVFRNPSGLPDSHQVTTARDMAVLGLALYRDFPQHYYRFKARAFTYKGQIINNHNKLLGKVPGVDGFKTGYTVASGFNLTASAKRNNRRLIVVVMGGANRHWRDRRVTELFEKHFKKLPSLQQAIYEETVDEDPEDSFESQVIDDVIKNIVVEDGQLKEPVATPVSAPQTITVVKAKPKRASVVKKKPQATAGVQIGAFKNKLQATIAAQRVAKFSGGTVLVKSTKKKGKGNLFLAQVKGLTMEQAQVVCKDLKGQHRECLPFSKAS
ncbi:MAG: D-alanyl-D-alanine carboxypeptidase family protein [Alphaproteobacteria bacterium]